MMTETREQEARHQIPLTASGDCVRCGEHVVDVVTVADVVGESTVRLARTDDREDGEA